MGDQKGSRLPYWRMGPWATFGPPGTLTWRRMLRSTLISRTSILHEFHDGGKSRRGTVCRLEIQDESRIPSEGASKMIRIQIENDSNG